MTNWHRQYPLSVCTPDDSDVAKAESSAPKKKRGWVSGWLNVEEEDAQGDIMYAKGMDTADFVRSGFFVYEHPSLAHMIVGRPTHTEVKEHPSGHLGVFCKGFFYLSDPMGKLLYEKAVALEQDEDDENRRLAFSVEGKALEQAKRTDAARGLHIYKSRPHSAAITHRPVNFKSRFRPELMDIAASLHEADVNGTLVETLSAILENRVLVKSLTDADGLTSDPTVRRVGEVASRFGLSRVDAARLVDRIYSILG